MKLQPPVQTDHVARFSIFANICQNTNELRKPRNAIFRHCAKTYQSDSHLAFISRPRKNRNRNCSRRRSRRWTFFPRLQPQPEKIRIHYNRNKLLAYYSSQKNGSLLQAYSKKHGIRKIWDQRIDSVGN